jgi:glutamyl-tRNA reductase
MSDPVLHSLVADLDRQGLLIGGEAASPELDVALTGVSYRTLDIAGREELARQVPQPEALSRLVLERGLASEAAVISTCNRFELLSVGGSSGGLRDLFAGLLGATHNPDRAVYQFANRDAVKHLYRVSSSLDSMIVGETQIVGQLKQAYRRAVEAGSVGSSLHHLFQSAFRVAKRVRASTEIARHGVSVSCVGVRLAQQIFADLREATVLLIGSGEVAELVAVHLCGHGCRKIFVANRTLERATALAQRFGGAALALSDIGRLMNQVDIVISSITVEQPLITADTVHSRRRDAPLFLIDLSLPRTIDPHVDRLESVYLYNIDDLAAIAAQNRALRQTAAQEAEVVVEQGLRQFERWQAKVQSQPQVVALRERVLELCRVEAARATKGVGERDPAVAERLGRALGQRLAHEVVELMRNRNEEDR